MQTPDGKSLNHTLALLAQNQFSHTEVYIRQSHAKSAESCGAVLAQWTCQALPLAFVIDLYHCLVHLNPRLDLL